MAIDKAALLAKRVEGKTAEVELPSGDGTVVVRGLTRKEALSVQGQEMDPMEAERVLLSFAMVDPKMSQDEIGQWQEVCSAGELVPVVGKVLAMSGMEADAPKQAMKEFRS